MTHLPAVHRHLATDQALDYLDGRGDAAWRQVVEEHLDAPCPTCRGLVCELRLLVERMRLDRAPQVPTSIRARAFDAWNHGGRTPRHPLVPDVDDG